MTCSASTAIKSYSFPVDDKTSPGGKSARGSEKAGSIYSNRMYARSLSTTSGQRSKTTPASSNNTSPHHGLLPLPPPMTPVTARIPAYLGRRESLDASINGLPGFSRRLSTYRRPSMSYSASPSSSSLKHLGEGALDDSDSSSSSESDGDDEQKDMTWEDEESDTRKTHISPAVLAARISHPSPLSRVAGQHRWEGKDEAKNEENDDDEASASPRSTDSEVSDGGSTSVPRPGTLSSRRVFRRNSASVAAKKTLKSRSLSATIQNQPASSGRLSNSSQKPLARQESSSSIRTVTACGESCRGDQNGLKAEETVKDLRNTSVRQIGCSFGDEEGASRNSAQKQCLNAEAWGYCGKGGAENEKHRLGCSERET